MNEKREIQVLMLDRRRFEGVGEFGKLELIHDEEPEGFLMESEPITMKLEITRRMRMKILENVLGIIPNNKRKMMGIPKTRMTQICKTLKKGITRGSFRKRNEKRNRIEQDELAQSHKKYVI